MRAYLLGWANDVVFAAPDGLTIWAMERPSRGLFARLTVPLARVWMSRCMTTEFHQRQAHPHLWRHWPRRVILLRRARLRV